MSNLIYGPDGNPIPQEEEHTSPTPSRPGEEKEKGASSLHHIPYPMHNLYRMDLDNIDMDDTPPPPEPFIKNTMELVALICGIVSLLMLFVSSYYGIFLMFAAGLSAVILGLLCSHADCETRRVRVLAMIMGFSGVLLFIFQIISIIIMTNNPELMHQLQELYQQVYGTGTEQPGNLRDLFQI